MLRERPGSEPNSESSFLRIQWILRAMALATILLLSAVLFIDRVDSTAKFQRDSVGMILGLIFVFGTWYLAKHIPYIPRVTPSVRIGSAIMAFGLLMNFVEDLPWIAPHPFYGNAGTLHALKIDSAIIVIGVLILLCSSYFVILELAHSRFEISNKSVSLDESLKEQQKLYNVLRYISEEIHSDSEEPFFQSLVKNLSIALRADYAIVAECVGVDDVEVRTLAAWANGHVEEQFKYGVCDLPYEDIQTGESKFHPTGLQGLLPRESSLAELDADSYIGMPLRNTSGAIVGHLAVLAARPLPTPFPNQTILDTFALRAGAELERLRAETALRKSEARYRHAANIFQTSYGIRTRRCACVS
jgi:hypothetical protein